MHIRYVYTEEKNGKPYTYFRRRKGTPKIPMQHNKGEPGFEGEYHGLMSQVANGTLALRIARPRKQGHIDERGTKSIGGMARAYFESAIFRRMGQRSQYDRRRYIERCLRIELTDKNGSMLAFGKFGTANLSQPIIITLRDKLPDPVRSAYPEADVGAFHDKHVHALRAMFSWAVQMGLIIGNPAAKIEPLSQESDGWHTWTDDEVRQFLAHWPLGSRPHLAFMLLRHTAVRRSDVVTFGTPTVRKGVLYFTEVKFNTSKVKRTLKHREVVIRPALTAVIDATPGAREGATFLKTEKGTPFSAATFTHQFKQWCIAAGLPHCTAHGVRKWVATSLAEKDASEHTIAAVLGHSGTKNVAKYVKKVRQHRLFEAGMDMMAD